MLFVIDAETRELVSAGRRVRLTVREMLVFSLLAKRIGQPVHIEVIRAFVYCDRFEPPRSRIIDVFVCNIRAKLRSIYCPLTIINVRSFGYRLDRRS